MPHEFRKRDSDEDLANNLTEATQQETLQVGSRTVGPSSQTAESVKQVPVPRASGPRSQAGKQRSSHNSLKYGIFSDVMVLRGEPRKKCASLLENLREDLRPEGALEEILVEKLAMFSWRLRRLLKAESAEIQKNDIIDQFDSRNQKQEESEGLSRAAHYGKIALISEIQNPHVLELCVVLLGELRQTIKSRGFNEEKDLTILERIYGSGSHFDENLQDVYATNLNAARLSDEERKQDKMYPAPEECKHVFLYEIDREVRQLRRASERSRLMESDQIKTDVLLRMVPDSPALERLMRYEAGLERSFDRTLSQLERQQRMRKGQPVSPTIRVEVESNHRHG